MIDRLVSSVLGTACVCVLYIHPQGEVMHGVYTGLAQVAGLLQRCWLWDAFPGNMQGQEMGLLAASFLGSELEFDLPLYVLPAWGNLVSLWIGHIFPFLLASSQRNHRNCLSVNIATATSGLQVLESVSSIGCHEMQYYQPLRGESHQEGHSPPAS